MATARKRDKDTDEMVAGIRRQVRALETRAGREDPWAAADMLRLGDELHDRGYKAIERLRQRGVKWNDIGFSLGVSGVTAAKRYRRWAAGKDGGPAGEVAGP